MHAFREQSDKKMLRRERVLHQIKANWFHDLFTDNRLKEEH